MLVLSLSALTELRLSGLAGTLFAFVSAVSFAVAPELMKRFGPSVPLLAMTAWQFLLGALPLLALSALLERTAVVRWTPPFVGLLLLLGLSGTALTTATWYWLIQRDDVGRLALYLFLVPIVGLVLAVVLLGEQLTIPISAGMALTLLGVLGALRRDVQQSRLCMGVSAGAACSCSGSPQLSLRPASRYQGRIGVARCACA